MNCSVIQIAFWIQAVVCVAACPLLTAQEIQVASIPLKAQVDPGARLAAPAQQLDAVSERNHALRTARTLQICTQTMFVTTGTLDRALMKQKDWDRLGLNIVNNAGRADLELQINRVVFTHVHTYILTDRASGIVLASGKVTALDGVIASGPMAEQIVKVLAQARLAGNAASGRSGL